MPPPSASAPHSWCRRKAPKPVCFCPRPSPSALQMQDADEREKTARGFEIRLYLAGEPVDEKLGAFIVDRAPPHIQGFDLRRRRGADGFVVAVADQEVILHDAAE